MPKILAAGNDCFSSAEHEIRSALEREVDAERWTRLDVAIRMAADETGFIDLRPDNPGAGDPEVRRLAIGRLQRLERLGLATVAGSAQWMVGLDANAACATLACVAISSRSCTVPSPSGVRTVASQTM